MRRGWGEPEMFLKRARSVASGPVRRHPYLVPPLDHLLPDAPPSVLLVEDDRGLRESPATVLTYQGMQVIEAGSAEDAIDVLAAHHVDLIVLDVNLPGADGFELLRRLRAAGDHRQVLMLTARHEVADRVAGLDAGADDYLPKPFALDELLARVRTMIRRSGNDATVRADPGAKPDSGQPLTLGTVTIEPGPRRVSVAGAEVALTKLEFDLLELLFGHVDQVLPRSIIHERVWGYDESFGSNTLDVLVSSLRRKLDHAGAPRVVETVRGVGYVVRPGVDAVEGRA
jgi:two-component system, OmpR family, response regulator MprA